MAVNMTVTVAVAVTVAVTIAAVIVTLQTKSIAAEHGDVLVLQRGMQQWRHQACGASGGAPVDDSH